MTRRAEPGRSTIIVGHGSFLTCHRRLACTSTRHARLRRAYYTALAAERRRAAGVGPAKRGRTHGNRATYRVCAAGADGGPCEKCKEAERSYKADYRARAS
jgi:hypothetical protein